MDIAVFIKRYGIGLTGGIATGKSTIARILRREGFRVFDADQFAREVVQPNKPALAKIIATFGEDLLSENQSLDRKKLGALVFNDREKRTLLEAILHPAIATAFNEEIVRLGIPQEHNPKPFFYEAALLFEANSADKFREIWVTTCSPETQLRRLIARNNITEQYARSMIAQQLPVAEKAKRASVVIDTEGRLEEVEEKTALAISALSERFNNNQSTK